jgi:hypothetical protein
MSAAREAVRRAKDDGAPGGAANARRAGPGARSEPDAKQFVSARRCKEGDPQGPTLREFREADARLWRVARDTREAVGMRERARRYAERISDLCREAEGMSARR